MKHIRSSTSAAAVQQVMKQVGTNWWTAEEWPMCDRLDHMISPDVTLALFTVDAGAFDYKSFSLSAVGFVQLSWNYFV